MRLRKVFFRFFKGDIPMKTLNRYSRRYLREVRRRLPCSGKLKHRVIQELETSLVTFQAENPNSDYNALIARFGTPSQIAATYIEDMNTTELFKNIRLKRTIVKIVSLTAIILILIWCLSTAWALYENRINGNGYFVEEIITERK